MWFDSHCHTSYMSEEIEKENNFLGDLTGLVTIACSKAEWTNTQDYISNLDNVWMAAGVHPHEAKDGLDGLEEVLKADKVVGVGECGLDYYYDHSPRDVQQEIFAEQIKLALDTKLTLVVHTRNAWDDTLGILKDVGVPEKTIIHCFSGGVPEAKKCLDLNTYLSFSGIVTFPSASEDVAAAANYAPLEKILVETDSPYLSPVPLRGQKNYPNNVRLVGEFIAKFRGESIKDFETITTQNCLDAFGIEIKV